MQTSKAIKRNFAKTNKSKKRNYILQENTKHTVKKTEFKSYYLYGIILLFVVVLYGNTIVNDYALDDSIVITLNKYTQSGIEGIKNIFLYDSFKGFDDTFVNSVAGGRYRPISIATFAIEKQCFGNNPHISHIINIMLYACSCLLLYSLLSKLLQSHLKSVKWYNSVPFLTTLLFAAHPIHTEVVANIKSRDEILALLFSFLTMWFILSYFDTKKILYLVFSPILFFLALLSKEIAIVFIVLLPVSFYYFTPIPVKKIILSIIPLIAISVLFIIIRQIVIYKSEVYTNVIKDISNYSFAEMNIFEKYATITYSLGLYLKLILFPHPLTWDYYPYHISIKEWTDITVIISVLIYGVLSYLAIKGIRNKRFYSYCIIVFLVPLSLTANIFFPVGAFMCERFLYISSLGFALYVSYMITEYPHTKYTKLFSRPLLLIIPILFLYTIKTIDRNKAWKNDETIVTTDVKTSKNSMRSTCEYGNILYKKGEHTDNQEEKMEYYNDAMQYEEKAYSICKNLSPANFILGTLYAKYKNDLSKAVFYLNNSIKLDPDNIDSYNNLGIVFCITKQYNKAIEVFNEALKKDSTNLHILQNISMSYRYLGQETKANYYSEKLKKALQ